MACSTSGTRDSDRVDHLNRVLRTIVEINHLIVQEKDRSRLLQRSCDILTTNRDYRFAWIGLIDPDDGAVSSRVSSGFESAYSSLLDADWADFVSKTGPAGKALLTKQTVIVCCPEHLIQIHGVDGYGAHCSGMAAVPLVNQGEVRGVLVVYTIDANYFDDGEISLLEEVAGDIAFALRGMDEERRRLEAEARLEQSENLYRTTFEGTGTAMLIVDEDMTIAVINDRGADLLGMAREDIEGKCRWTDFVAPEDLERMSFYHRERRLRNLKVPDSYEFCLVDTRGNRREILLNVGLVPGTMQSVCSLIDITERKRNEERLRYMVMHDTLTGVYNRAYFEEEMRRMDVDRQGPISMIICDVDGLKLINDAWGHDAGDELLRGAAGVIAGAFRKTDCVARIGGDEFAVILPATDYRQGSTFVARIRERQAHFNRSNRLPVPLGISIGLATTDSPDVSMNDLFKEADNAMYREQLLSKTSARRAVGRALMAALDARDFITEGHAERLREMAAEFGRTLGITETRMSNLLLLAQFHDIGKVGTPDTILFKQGPLTDEERAEMQRHSEIGHRIALSTGDLASIADLILKHHEWWNGAGYPLGLQGEDIPIECRILAILDAFDAMTSDRPYRKAMSAEMALAEIERCAGTQFDPALVPRFVEMIRNRDRSYPAPPATAGSDQAGLPEQSAHRSARYHKENQFDPPSWRIP